MTAGQRRGFTPGRLTHGLLAQSRGLSHRAATLASPFLGRLSSRRPAVHPLSHGEASPIAPAISTPLPVGDAEHEAAADDNGATSPIVFIHIPKTAGTAFSHYLTSHCGAPDKVLAAFYGDYSIYDGVTDAPVILGHTIYREMAARFPRASFVTWLRHPLQRVLSQYKSWHNPKNLHEHWKDHAAARQDFEHIYFTQLATFDEFVASDDRRLLNNITNAQTGILSSAPRNAPRQRVLASAKENLERHFRFFGLVERFDESIRHFKAAFDWTAEFQDDDATANRSNNCMIEPSEGAIRRVMQRNDLDMELYEFAGQLLDRRLAELQDGDNFAGAASARQAA